MKKKSQANADQLNDLSHPPPPLIPAELWPEFCEWAKDGGYDESYFNRYDSKSIALQEDFLVEIQEEGEDS